MLEGYHNPNLTLQLSQRGHYEPDRSYVPSYHSWFVSFILCWKYSSICILILRYFAVYAQSKCIPYRERAFDLLFEYAQKHRLGAVHAVGGCHGSHPEARRE